MEYKELLEQIKDFLSACEKMRYGEYVGAPWPYNHDGPMVYTEPDEVLLDLAATAITDLLARAEAAEAEVSELRKRLAEAEAACAYHKYRRGEANTSTRGLALTAYGLRQKLAEVEAQRDEAVHDRMMMEQRIGELNARAEAAEADNKKLCAAMMQLKRTDRPERMSVIYELEYDSSMSHKTMQEVAGIFFRGLMDADLKLRGQKEE